MISTAQTGRWLRSAVALAAVSVLVADRVCAQAAPAQATPPQATAASPSSEPGVMLDRLVAVVNGDVILESDVDEERRFTP